MSCVNIIEYCLYYISGESRFWDRRPFMDDFMEDPFDLVYGGTDEDDYDDYPFFDDYDHDDYYGSDY